MRKQYGVKRVRRLEFSKDPEAKMYIDDSGRLKAFDGKPIVFDLESYGRGLRQTDGRAVHVVQRGNYQLLKDGYLKCKAMRDIISKSFDLAASLCETNLRVIDVKKDLPNFYFLCNYEGELIKVPPVDTITAGAVIEIIEHPEKCIGKFIRVKYLKKVGGQLINPIAFP